LMFQTAMIGCLDVMSSPFYFVLVLLHTGGIKGLGREDSSGKGCYC
jgi:hypothetical protein